MASEQDLELHMQAISDGVAELAKEIADLKAAGVGAVTQAQLDALDATAQKIASDIQAAK